MGGLFSGAGEGLTVLGLLSCFLSPGLSGIGVDAGLLRGPYSAPNLLGSGTVMAKVMPPARLGGAAGYLQQVSGMERLLATVREFAAGELRVPADVMRRVFAGVRRGAETGDEPDLGGLMRREREILALFSRGLSYARIAEARGVRPVHYWKRRLRHPGHAGDRLENEFTISCGPTPESFAGRPGADPSGNPLLCRWWDQLPVAPRHECSAGPAW